MPDWKLKEVKVLKYFLKVKVKLWQHGKAHLCLWLEYISLILQDVNIPDLIKQLDILGDNGVSNELIKGSKYMNLPKEKQEILAKSRV